MKPRSTPPKRQGGPHPRGGKAKPTGIKVHSEQITGDYLKDLAALATFEKDCTAKKWATAPVPAFYQSSKPTAPEACKLAARTKDLGKKYLEAQAKAAAAAEAQRLQKAIAAIRAGNSAEANDHGRLADPGANVTRLQAIYDGYGKGIGVTTSASWYDAVTKTGAGYAAAVAEAGKTSRWPAAATLVDPATSSAVTAAHSSATATKKEQLLRAAAATDWSVEKNHLGVPTRRTREVHALLRAEGETHCRLYAHRVEATYKSGSWSKPNVFSGGSAYRISACK